MTISENRLKKLLSDFSVHIFDSIDSTNTAAKNEPCFTVIAANRQTGGRGRLGKSFFSPEGGIYMSLVMPETRLATIRTVVAVCRSIEAHSYDNITIKWVNDIFSNGKKVSGILCEKIGDRIVCGIGININRTSFPDELSDIAGSVDITTDRLTLISDIAKELLCVWSLSEEMLISEYRSKLFVLGKQIEYRKNGKLYSGVAVDINEDGNLIVANDEKYDVLNSGEISLGSNNFS